MNNINHQNPPLIIDPSLPDETLTRDELLPQLEIVASDTDVDLLDFDECQDEFLKNIASILDDDKQSDSASGLMPFTPPALFSYDYLARRDNLYPGKTEMSNFLIDHILDEKPFNLLFLDTSLDYCGANIWRKFLNTEVLNNINKHLYDSQCDFIHADLRKDEFYKNVLYLLHFNKQAVEQLKAVILHALTKTHALDNQGMSDDTLSSYRKFMDGMPKIGFNLTNVPFVLYRLFENNWINQFTELRFFNDFDGFDFELCTQLNDSKKADHEYGYLSLNTAGKNNSSLAINLYDFIEKYYYKTGGKVMGCQSNLV